MTEYAGPYPYVYARQIHWGETDAGGIVYTGQFLDFMMEATEMWWRDVVGPDWYGLKVDHDMGSPMVHASLDFSKPVYDGEILDLTVIVEKLGASSITHAIAGHGPDGTLRFRGKLVAAVVTLTPFKAVPVPENWRDRIEKYIEACENLDATHA